MKVYMKYVLLTTPVCMIIALIIFLPRLNQETSEHTSTVNEHIVETRSFEISADSTDLHTSAKGAVFIKADDGIPTYAQIVATIEIDPQDWGGVAFYTPNGWLISNITHSYPKSETRIQKLSDYVAIWTTTDKEWNTMIEFGRNRNYRPTGGGTGTIVIDLVPDRHAQQPKTFSIVVEVGSDERNGVKIMGTDSIEVPISLSKE